MTRGIKATGAGTAGWQTRGEAEGLCSPHRLRSGYNDTREVLLSRGLKCRLGGRTGGGEVRA